MSATITIFITLLMLCGIVAVIWQLVSDKRIERATATYTPGSKKEKKRGKLFGKEKEEKEESLAISDVSSLGTIERKLAVAGLDPEPGPWIVKLVGAMVLGTAIGTALASPAVGAAVAVAMPVAAWVILGMKGKKRTAKFEQQLCLAELQIAENLRSGLSVSKSLRIVSDQTEEPLKSHFDAVYNAITFSNVSLPEALGDMARRTASPDVELLGTVIRVQDETGSDLSESLETLSDMLDRRTKMRNELKTSLAEIKMTVKIVAALPAIILAFTWFFYDGYADFYGQMPGLGVIIGIAIVETIALLILSKMADIKLD